MRWPGPTLLTVFLIGSLSQHAIRADEALTLQEPLEPGYQYHVSSRVELSGSLVLPPDKNQAAQRLKVSGSSALEYDEKVLESERTGEVNRTIRIYRRVDFHRLVGDRPQDSSIRPAVRRLVVLRHDHAEVPFSPDGPLTWGEIDLVRTDVFTPALRGLLPAQAVRLGDSWAGSRAAIRELTDMERVDDGRLQCRFEQITTLAGRPYARIAFAGSVQGINEDGPNRQQLDGYLLFDLESRHLGYLSLKGISTLLDKDGKAQGSVEGRFVLTRQLRTSADLVDTALSSLTLQPNDENTLLLYDSNVLGIRFVYPRRWHVAAADASRRQIALDEPNGNGALITVEPITRVPTGEQFLAESQAWLAKQKARILHQDRPRQLRPSPQQLDQFALDVEVSGQRALLDYYIARQPTGGATLAARLLPADLTARRKEIERIAASIKVGGIGVSANDQ
jgi:hypothetical protein